MPPHSQLPYYAQPVYQSNNANANGMSSPRSPISRVQTIDSTSQITSMDLSSSPPQNFSDAPSEPDVDASAVQPWRYQDPRSPQPENAQVVYPQRQTTMMGFQQYGGVYPTDQSWSPPPLQHRGTASSGFGGGFGGGFGFSRSDTFGSTTSSTSQRNGHRYGKVTIKGKGRVIQGNAYDGHQPPSFMRENEYGEVEVEDEGRLKQGDVPTGLAARFLGHEEPGQQREHQGESVMPRQSR